MNSFNKSSRLLSIGYDAGEHRPDPSCYDLLASEARFCSFVAIGRVKLPQEHWFMRAACFQIFGDPVLYHGGGSMFEYLMPLLVHANVRRDAA